MEIWAWVATERTRRGWSQSELARRAGVSSQLISAGEAGRKPRPSGDTVIALAQAFGVTVEELRTLAAGTTPDPAPFLAALRALGMPEDKLQEFVKFAPDLTAFDWAGFVDTARRRHEANTRRKEARAAQRIRPHPDPPGVPGLA